MTDFKVNFVEEKDEKGPYYTGINIPEKRATELMDFLIDITVSDKIETILDMWKVVIAEAKNNEELVFLLFKAGEYNIANMAISDQEYFTGYMMNYHHKAHASFHKQNGLPPIPQDPMEAIMAMMMKSGKD